MAPALEMSQANPSVIVTGVSGNLGRRLLPLLNGFRITGIDLSPPTALPASTLERFVSLDLGDETSCRHMVAAFKQANPAAVVHLAFVIDPVRAGILDVDRMWRINVAGTARVMEAITEHNRTGGAVTKFVYPSSVSAYGPDLPGEV